MIPSITNRNVLMADIDTPDEVAKMFNDVYRICRAHNLAILKLSGKGENQKGGAKTSHLKKGAMAVVVLCLLFGSSVLGSVPWNWEYGTNPDLMDAFMRNPNFANMGMDTVTLKNGLTIENSTNDVLEINEGGEDLLLTFSSDTTTWSSTLGVVTMGFGAIVPTANQFRTTPVSTAVGTVEGTLYYDSDDDKLYLRNASAWVDLTATTTSTFDDIYNNSAAALGITVDVGPTVWTATDAANVAIFSLIQSDTATSKVLTITNAGTGNTIDIQGQAAGKDIEGTGDTWNVTGAGAATFVSGVIPTLTATTITLSNGATIANTTDTEIAFAENSEDLIFDFTTDGLTIKTSTGVAAINWADTDDFTGLNNLTFDAEASTINLPANGAGDNLTISVSGTQDSHLTVSSAGTTEDALTISTTNGGINITNNGAAAGEDIDLSSTAASINLSAAEAVGDAITLNASNAVGGITAAFGTGNFAITGTGVSADFTVDADLLSIDGTGVSNITVTSDAGSEDFTVALAGATDSHLVVSSTGTSANAMQLTASAGGIAMTGSGAIANAIAISASNAAGGITAGYGAGNMVITGSGASADFTLDCDLFSIDGIGTSNVTVTSDAGSEDFTIALAGNTDSSLVLSSTGTADDAFQITTTAGGVKVTNGGAAGGTEDILLSSTNASISLAAAEAVTDAIKLNASNAAGGITVAFGTGNMAITGTGVSADFTLDCDLFSVDGTGLANITVTSNVDAEDFTVALAGATNSSLVLSSTGTAADALQLTASAGGILVSPSGAMADQFKVLAAGTIAGNAINLATTNGGIVLTAGNAANGDLTFTVGDAWTANVTGNTALTSTGTMALSSSDWKVTTDGVVTKLDAITFDSTGAGIDANTTKITGFKYNVEHLLANDTLTAAESGKVFYVAKAGAGAAADHVITLPAAAAGLVFTIIDANETAAADVTVTCASGDKIDDGAATGSYVHDTDADNYAALVIYAIDDVDWVVISKTGTWTNE